MSARLVSLLALVAAATAHATVFSIWRNGADLGDGRNVYIRSPPNNNPVKDLSLTDMVCNVNGGVEAPKFITAAAGDTLTFEWYHNTRGDDIIDGTHHGPIITYIAPYTSSNGNAPIWTKIQEQGYDATTKTWAVDALKLAGGKHDVALPSTLKAGKYLIRQEIIALHESETLYTQDPLRGAQFYPSCAQLEVTGSGTVSPPDDFDFLTGYTYADPGIHFNFYSSFTSYEIPGPDVWTGAGGSSPASPAAPTSTKAAAVKPTTTAAAVKPTTTAAVVKPTTTAAAVKPTTTAAAVKPTTTTAAAAKPTGCRGRSRKAKRAAKRAERYY